MEFINGFPKGKYVFLWGGLIANAGGMTRAMLKRANVLIEHGLDVTILLCARGMEQLNAVNHYKALEYPYIEEKNFITMETFWANKLSNPCIKHDVPTYGLYENLPFEKTNKDIIYYDSGEIVARELTNCAENTKIIVKENKEETVRYIFYKEHFSRKEVTWGGDNKRQMFFSESGFCHTVVYSVLDGKIWKEQEVKLFGEINRTVKSFSNMMELSRLFFETYVLDLKEKEIFVFCDPILDFDPGFGNMVSTDKNIYRIGINHGAGIGENRTWDSKLNPRLRDNIELANPPKMDALLLLTNEAMDDFVKRMGNTIFYHFPNTISIPAHINDFNTRDRNSVVYVGRLDERIKQISHIIKAFEKVSKTHPDAKLNIYGRGDDLPLYESMISDLNLKECVILHGFSNNVPEIYQSAAFSVQTSDFEGFSLSLLESLANGCPVVAYDFKYGVKDAITDEINGCIVPKNHIDQLADKICCLLDSPDKLKTMSENAKKMIMAYHEDNYVANLKSVLCQIVEKYQYKTDIKIKDFEIQEQRIIPAEKKVEVTCRLKIQGDVPEISKGKEKIYIRLYNDESSDYNPIDIDCCEATEDLEYKFKFEIPLSKYKNKICLCIEWVNSFLMQDVKLL